MKKREMKKDQRKLNIRTKINKRNKNMQTDNKAKANENTKIKEKKQQKKD